MYKTVIRRVRTDQIARRLVKADLPVAKIADLLEFPDSQHIARYFQSVKHISPVAYRKTHVRPSVSLWRSQTGDSFPRSGFAPTAEAELK
jgi:AraC-like DNA-binding protein